MARPVNKLLPVYVALVVAAGLAALSFHLSTQGSAAASTLRANPVVFGLLAVMALAAEVRPLSFPRGNGTDHRGVVGLSFAFAFATLLLAGPVPAILIYIAASVLSDVSSRVVWWKTAFNASLYTLSISAAAAVVGTVGTFPTLDPVFDPRNLAAVFLGGFAAFAVNTPLLMVALTNFQRSSTASAMRDNFLFEARVSAVLTAISPLVAVAAQNHAAMVPLIAVPVVILYLGAATTLAKEHQALHDALTGLPNRTLFYDRAEHALKTARRTGTAVALLIIDLDRFKEVNDTLGHYTGDQLLKEVGPRLQQVLRSADTIARLGGDEFGVVLENVSSEREAQAIAAKLIIVLQGPFRVNDLRLDVEASIGIALSTGDVNETGELLVQHADVAMYAAKESNSGYTMYQTHLDHYAPDHLSLVADLRGAVANGELEVYYQPKVGIESNRVEGVEALVRWRHPVRGLIMPDDFIPLAEQTGLIKPLTFFVLQQSLDQLRRWNSNGLNLTVAVNLSARTLHDELLPSAIARILRIARMPPESLQLELTESSIMADRVRSQEVLDELDRMGIAISIDDFGTGYSSLAYLKRLPVQEIKVDKSFVVNMANDENDSVIACSTVELGRNLGLRTVAEGVETLEVLRLLRAVGCDQAQGFYFSHPLPAAELTQWMDEFHSSRSSMRANHPNRPAM